MLGIVGVFMNLGYLDLKLQNQRWLGPGWMELSVSNMLNKEVGQSD